MIRVSMLLARKDLRTLIRSRLLLALLVVYPVLLACVLGAVLLNANQGARIALVNKDTSGSTLKVGDASFGIKQYREQAEAAGVDIVEMSMDDAQEALNEGQVQGILVIPQGFIAKLSTQLAPSEIELHTGSSAISDLVSQRVRGVIYKINLRISKALIDENAKYLERLVTGGEVEVLGESYDLYGLQPLRDDLEQLRDSLSDEDARDTLDTAIGFSDDAGAALKLADNALNATAAPVRLQRVVESGKSPALTARAMSFALGVTLTLICLTLVSASLAAERDERVLPRLLRSGASPASILLSKCMLGAAIGTVFSLGLFAVFAVLAPQAWTRLPLLLACVVVASLTLSTLGALIATLTGDARSASLVAILAALPMIPMSLVGGDGLLHTLAQLLPLTPAMNLFNSALFDADPARTVALSVAHLLVIAGVAGGLAGRLLRRLA